MNDGEDIFEVFLVVNKGVIGEGVVLFDSEELFDGGLFLLVVQVGEQEAHAVKHCDLAHPAYQFLLHWADCLYDISYINQDLLMLLVLRSCLYQLVQAKHVMPQVL